MSSFFVTRQVSAASRNNWRSRTPTYLVESMKVITWPGVTMTPFARNTRPKRSARLTKRSP